MAIDANRVEVLAAKARGYAGRGNTPEYKREQRRRAAIVNGRPFRTLNEIRLSSPMVKVEQQASNRGRAVYREFLSACNQIGDQERRNAAFRARYWKRPDYERARTINYKTLNPSRKAQWERVRYERMTMTADGTATVTAIAELKAVTTCCSYCAEPLDAREKQTDHVVPLCAGGAHSLSNIVIACATCNGRKARLEYGEWVERQAMDVRRAA